MVGHAIPVDTKIKKVCFIEETDDIIFADYANNVIFA